MMAPKVAAPTRSVGMASGRSSAASPTTTPVTTPRITPTACRPWFGRPGARQMIAVTAAKTGCGCPKSAFESSQATAEAAVAASASASPALSRAATRAASPSTRRSVVVRRR